jgi:hypothetical protein
MIIATFSFSGNGLRDILPAVRERPATSPGL